MLDIVCIENASIDRSLEKDWSFDVHMAINMRASPILQCPAQANNVRGKKVKIREEILAVKVQHPDASRYELASAQRRLEGQRYGCMAEWAADQY